MEQQSDAAVRVGAGSGLSPGVNGAEQGTSWPQQDKGQQDTVQQGMQCLLSLLAPLPCKDLDAQGKDLPKGSRRELQAGQELDCGFWGWHRGAPRAGSAWPWQYELCRAPQEPGRAVLGPGLGLMAAPLHPGMRCSFSPPLRFGT